MELLFFIAGFIVIALAARQIGDILKNTGLPLISGFLFTGIITGPYVLDLISAEAVRSLRFVDEVALGVIAFAAGSELYIKELRHRLKTIAWITTGLVVSTFSITSIVFFMLSGFMPFTADMPLPARIGVSLLAGAIFVARSPSSAIAIVNELRAKGPFTQTVLGVTVIMDVVVITLFATNSSIADALFTGLRFNFGFVLLLATELLCALVLGILVSRVLVRLLYFSLAPWIKTAGILLTGYLVFELSAGIRSFTHSRLPFEILLEPLLICMIAGFLTGNASRLRKEFLSLLSTIGPPVYIAFFTLTGASLSLDILAKTWPVALALFLARGAAIFAGAFLGSLKAGMPARDSSISWMAYITQAGVGLGLAREVVVAFPEWGMSFATIIIAVIFLNQILGPPLFKKAIRLMNEDHSKAKGLTATGLRDAVIFGACPQAITLSNSLASQGWEVRLALPEQAMPDALPADVPVTRLPQSYLDPDSLARAGADKASAIVAMLTDQENYRICELAYEHFGTQTLVARLHDTALVPKFLAIGVLVVDPAAAGVNLMDYFVRSPAIAALLMDLNDNQKITDLYMQNPALSGMALRDLKLPLDTVVMSIRRQDTVMVPHDYTRLSTGDRITLLGSSASLRSTALKFDVHTEHALADMVEKAVPRELGEKPRTSEVKQLIKTPGQGNRERFNNLVRDCQVLDLDREMDHQVFFKAAGAALCSRLDLQPSTLADMLRAREEDVSTVLAPGLAVPHIIIKGSARFDLLMVRARRGIVFDPEQPRVFAAFVLAGTMDERQFHLFSLSAIAGVALDPRFEQKWLRARNHKALRRLLMAKGEEGQTTLTPRQNNQEPQEST